MSSFSGSDFFKFRILARDKKTKARVGELLTPHGVVHTPQLVFVGTQGSVKSLSPRDLHEAGVEIVLANTYHLHLRPGEDIIQSLGGLAKFMGWEGPTMTDSGGFQVFSLGIALEHGVSKLLREEEGEPKPKPRLNKVTEEGVIFQSHIDGSYHTLTPELSIEIQEKLGADLIVSFDDHESPLFSYEETKKSLELTNRWLLRSARSAKRKDQLLYGVTHGGEFEDLRIESARFVDKNFAAIAIGGVYKDKENMYKIARLTVENSQDSKPKHMLGVGEVEDIFNIVAEGIDTFDCVIPTRLGRMGFVFMTPPFGNKKNRFRIDITKERFAAEKAPIDKNCQCYTCENFSCAYINHLFRSRELLAYRLATLHNIYFFVRLMTEIRKSIQDGYFENLRKTWTG